MSAGKLPPLPEPAMRETNPYAGSCIDPYPGEEHLVWYTAQQMTEYGQASRMAALEEAAKECERLSNEYRGLYKGRTNPVQKNHCYNPHTDGMSDGCTQCHDAIKEL